jgi:hypothetical protein
MCDCEELDYDDFMVMLKAIGTPSASLEVMQTQSPALEQESVPIPLVVSTKRKK